MEIVCLDMEGTLTPEIWERVALNTGIEELGKTTRDIPSYEELMDMRLQIMSEKGIKLSDVQKAADSLELLPGAYEFVSNLRNDFQVVILSDTFHDIAKPLMEKLGFPFLLCHNLNIKDDDQIKDQEIIDIKDLFTAENNDISFFHSKKYNDIARNTKASFCLTSKI